VAVEGTGLQLLGSNEEAVGLGEQGDNREELDFHDRIWVALGISGRGKGAGRK